MREYNYRKKWQDLLTPEIVSLLSKIHEFKGEQMLFIESYTDELTELLEVARIQSVEASNGIEGIYTSDERLKKIVQSKTMPKSRDELEIAGYRDVLNTIHDSYEHIPIKPAIILQLHRDLYKFSSNERGGSYKNSDNVITETDGQGDEWIRFEPVASWETAESIKALCKAFDDVINSNDLVDPLIIMPMFILDFLCIHPFNDGNGRLSRLLTLLLLYHSNYIVGKYISIEKIVELSKDAYYEALQASSFNWHENKNDYVPFVEYTLETVAKAYRDFSSRIKILTTSGMSKPDRVREIIKENIGKITKADIMIRCPDISQVTVQRALNDLVKSGKIIKIGGGRYTAYTWNREGE